MVPNYYSYDGDLALFIFRTRFSFFNFLSKESYFNIQREKIAIGNYNLWVITIEFGHVLVGALINLMESFAVWLVGFCCWNS